MTTPHEKLTLTVMECARLMGLSKGSTYEAVRQGTIPSLRIGRRLVIPRAALERMLEGQGGKDARA